MIQSRISNNSQTTIPRAVRLALGLLPGDDVVWEIKGSRVMLARALADPFTNNFTAFTEWAGEADCKAFDSIDQQ